MSDLTLSLVVLGAIAVAGVYLFNRVQERKFRRETEQSFSKPEHDALLDEPTVTRVKQRNETMQKESTQPLPSAVSIPKDVTEPTLGLAPLSTPASSFKTRRHIERTGAVAIASREVE